MTNKTNERGAIMIEVIAVLALIGAMGTLLFRQVLMRNQEVDNVNMATEARIMKESTLAYIQANRAVLLQNDTLNPSSGNGRCISPNLNDVAAFIPDGYVELNASNQFEGIIDYYNITICAYKPTDETEPVMYGIIVPKGALLPSKMNLKRASRVAALIGSGGGVWPREEDELSGTMGGWHLPNDDLDWPGSPTFVAITGMDIFVPEPENLQQLTTLKLQLDDDAKFSNLHASDFLSVGAATTNCFRNTGTAEDPEYEILRPGERNTDTGDICDPLFWVGTVGSDPTTDHSTQGHVYAKQNIYVGRDNTNDRHAIALENKTDKGGRITVFDKTGQQQLSIDGEGRLLAGNADSSSELEEKNAAFILHPGDLSSSSNRTSPKIVLRGLDTDDEMEIREGRISVAHQTPEGLAEGAKKSYQLDPAHTSLVNEIRLAARGGARLSDLLPNYISKTMKAITSRGTGAYSEHTQAVPTCPNGYTAAVMVTPTRWDASRLSEIDISHQHSVNVGNFYVDAPADGDEAPLQRKADKTDDLEKTEHIVKATDSHDDDTPKIKMEKVRLAVVIDKDNPEKTAALQTETEASAGEWTIRMGYVDDNNKWSGTVGDTISAVVQTFCVYDPTAHQDTIPCPERKTDSLCPDGCYDKDGVCYKK